MPVIKSAAKQLRQSIKARERNLSYKTKARQALKQVEKNVKAKNTEGAKDMLKDAYSKIDTMVKKNLIHQNTAARRKSKVMKMVNKMAK